MTAFHAPTEDILFSLRHVARADRLPDWDDELAGEIISHFGSIAEDRIAPLNAPGDAQGCRLESGRVRMPDGFPEVYAEIAAGGWQGLAIPESYGGQGLSPVVQAGVSEIFTGANHSMQMVCALVLGAVDVLLHFGTDAQKAEFLPPLAAGSWVSTMCLTEPGAGSDLSAIRTRAELVGDHWLINGEKIFISGGDQDMSDEILHLILARTGESKDGVQGLSLFACRSNFDNGRRNAITVARIEEKMGLHASPTCQLVFDGAEATLIGGLGEGLRAMFAMMNHARIDVSLQGVAHAARAADLARGYARERKQGRDSDGQVLTIDQHPDVSRMIDKCDALALGGRALCHITLVAQEMGTERDFVEFMTPVCKVFCTEAGSHAADMAIQVMGGYGYLREYGAEQNWRDSRICAIYEGTNGIHARTTATRSLRQNDGAGAKAFASFLRDCDAAMDGEVVKWEASARHLASAGDALERAHNFMEWTCDLAYRAAWARLKAAARHSTSPERLLRLAGTVLG
mgnify:CR=1 FL=1|tara:strand:- start:4935 stop:6479 length:1545 start_codon:yes stop_codon:yes gene_type:complete